MSESEKSEDYLEIIKKMGIVLPRPGEDFQEAKPGIKAPFGGKIPFFCTRCDEIRGTEGKGTVMQNSHEELMWKSFGMCSVCYLFSRDNPEQTAINQKKWKEKKAKEQQEAQALKDATKYRVYFEDNTKFGRSSFVNSFSPIEFGKYPFPFEGQEATLVVKSKKKVTLEEAEKVVALIKAKEIEAWYIEES